jgi:hypothetical protein
MGSQDLQPWQAQIVRKSLGRHLNYLYRFKSRMEEAGLRPSDPLFVKLKAAYDAVFDLSIDLHYRGCSSGVGLPQINRNKLRRVLLHRLVAARRVILGIVDPCTHRVSQHVLP